MSVIVVTFGVDTLDLGSVPPGWPIVIVHNDGRLGDDAVQAAPNNSVEHVRGHGNVGFAAGANLGLARAATDRVVFCNPDTTLSAEHWKALASSRPEEIVSIPMVDDEGRPASVVNPYPTPLALLLTAFRVGRLAPRGTALRRRLGRLLGRWGRGHAASSAPGRWPLDESWCSGAILSVDTARARAVDGFDERYFLYYEDADFCRRMADHFGDMEVKVAPVTPARHMVGGSGGRGRARDLVQQHLVVSAVRYAETARAASRDGSDLAWHAAAAALRLRTTWLARR